MTRAIGKDGDDYIVAVYGTTSWLEVQEMALAFLESDTISHTYFAADTMRRIRDAAQERLDGIEAAARDRKENEK